MGIIIDVREPFEFAESHVETALNIPLGQLNIAHPKLSTLGKDEQITVYCRSGGRAGIAKQYLESQGFTNVENGINQDTIEGK